MTPQHPRVGAPSFVGVEGGQEGGRLWEHPFQGRPRVNPTVKRGKKCVVSS